MERQFYEKEGGDRELGNIENETTEGKTFNNIWGCKIFKSYDLKLKGIIKNFKNEMCKIFQKF